MDRQAAVDDWTRRDHASALVPADHQATDSTRATRTMILERIDLAHRDLFHACAMLGTQLASAAASPSLVSSTMDHAAIALGLSAPPWLLPARASVFEAFVRARVEECERDALAAWEYPHGVVAVGTDAVAIAASLPSDDAESVTNWANRLAAGCARMKVRWAIVTGRHVEVVEAALDSVGIRTVPNREALLGVGLRARWRGRFGR